MSRYILFSTKKDVNIDPLNVFTYIKKNNKFK